MIIIPLTRIRSMGVGRVYCFQPVRDSVILYFISAYLESELMELNQVLHMH